MTAKQKAAREKFKAIIQEAKKLRRNYPKLTQAQAVKQAWAIEKRKKPGKIADVIVTYPSKKEAEYKMMRMKDGTFRGNQRISAVPRKTSKNYHKDTKSHNVNIRVVSGIKINYKRGKLGSLPVNFTGSVLGLKFRVYNQYNLDGTITAQIVEDQPNGYLIAELNGRPGEADAASKKFYSKIDGQARRDLERYPKDEKTVRARILKFLTGLSQDVKKFNSGKDIRTRKNEKLVISKEKPKKAASLKDNIKNLLRDDKKRLKYGYTIVPGKVLAGIYDKEKEIKGWTAVFSRLQGELLNERDKREKAKIRKEIAIAKTIISNLKKSKT